MYALNTIWAENPQLKRMVVINAYLDGKINLSKAAEELGLNRLELEEQLKTEGIPVRRLSEDDIRAEAEAVKRWYTMLGGNKKMSKVTAKYQITIPQKIRDELGIVPGCEVDIAKEGDKYIIIVNPVQEIKNKWCGRFKDGKTTDQYINEIRGKIN